MKLTLTEVLTLNKILKTIIDDTATKIDAVFKFKLLGIMCSIEPSVNNFELIRNEKIIEYGEKAEDGSISISPDNKDALSKFNADLTEVLNSTVDINISKLKASDVFNKGVKAEYLMGLYPIIEE